MKRVCTNNEKELLYKNRKQMINGRFGTASNERLGDVVIGIILGCIMIPVILYVFFVTDQIDVIFGKSKFTAQLFFLLPIIIMVTVIEKIMTWLRCKREEKRIKKRDDIMLNGATIIDVDLSGCFSYIEDDFYDENGKPIILEYTFQSGKMKQEDVGKRILVLYDGDFGYRLVKLNEELRGLIPNSTYDYPLKEDVHSYVRVPHPNMVKLEKAEHTLQTSEMKYFSEFYIKKTRDQILKRLKLAILWIGICIAFMFVLLNVEKGYSISKCIMFGTAAVSCLAILFFVLNFINKKIIEGKATFVSMKKVVFIGQGMRDKVALVRVFEWNENEVQLCEYKQNGLPENTPYGSILYRFRNSKNKFILLNVDRDDKRQNEIMY